MKNMDKYKKGRPDEASGGLEYRHGQVYSPALISNMSASSDGAP